MARTPFKLKSGNTSPFKLLGSSPVKHAAYGSPHPKNADTGVEESSHPSSAAAHNVKKPTVKESTSTKPSPAKQKIPTTGKESYKEYLNRAFKKSKDPYGKDVMDKKGWKKELGKKISTKNIKGNPYKGWHPQDIKVDKLATRTDLSKVQFEKKLAKITKTVDPYPNVGKKVLSAGKKVAKVGSKLLGGLAIGATLYDFYTSGQRHSGGKVGSKEAQAKWESQKKSSNWKLGKAHSHKDHHPNATKLKGTHKDHHPKKK